MTKLTLINIVLIVVSIGKQWVDSAKFPSFLLGAGGIGRSNVPRILYSNQLLGEFSGDDEFPGGPRKIVEKRGPMTFTSSDEGIGEPEAQTAIVPYDIPASAGDIREARKTGLKRGPMTFTSSDEGIGEPEAQTAIVPYDIPASAGDIREARKTGLIKQWDIEEATDRQIEETIDVSKNSQTIEGISEDTELRINFGDHWPGNVQLCVAFKEGTYGYDITLRLIMITDLNTYIKTLNGIFPRQTAIVLTSQQTGREWASPFQQFIPRVEEETNPQPSYTSVRVLVKLFSKAIFRVQLFLCKNIGGKVDKLSHKAEIKFSG